MKNNVEFYERQIRKQWWMYLLLAAINIIFIYGIIRQIFLGKAFGNNPMSDGWLIAATAIMFLFSIITLASRLDTFINSEGIYARYFPFNPKYKFFSWNDISQAYIREYRSGREFGGSGVRIKVIRAGGIHFNGREKAYIVSGRYGLQLELKNRKKILIGTQRPDEIKEVLKKLQS
ncbi:hypothetical protein D0T49_07120 [Paludibacter sp. 221]|uniref:hypothetical protein n=1 Tax=Paludibacter sp. 221 TaxID=2302939 RepID=UPI0013D2A02E|nr:hypothetical protein [Paludibacter sp. 221]NDV46816.1 hypothetical protein [Paludibacter sp. 221]